mmetsp:Transcript_47579/g.148835  ORF Transcript_47579/g.148835 Transcript_47579/m.148835 type:complete len:126 (+) Transcript_47579:158-535(+)
MRPGCGRGAAEVWPRVRACSWEQDESSSLGLEPASAVMLHFSLKEALYKAIHPLLPATIPWHSIAVLPQPDGRCAVLKADAFRALEADAGLDVEVQASWTQRHGVFVTTAAACAQPLGQTSADTT